jgi:Flp pilus assembly CpaF family ATPase
MTTDPSQIPALGDLPLFKAAPPIPASQPLRVVDPPADAPQRTRQSSRLAQRLSTPTGWSSPADSNNVALDADFWRQVTALRQQVSTRLSDALTQRPGLDEAASEELGRFHIQQVVRDHNDALQAEGRLPWSTSYEARMVKALFDAMFRLGRLQPLVERPDVENIEVYGHDRVLLILADGGREAVAPVAESDAELVEFLGFLASRDPDMERSFNRANPALEMPLPGRARLAAINWVASQPRVTIRIQQLQNVDLPMLRLTGELDYVLEEFLSAAVRARKSIVVSGQGQGSGKTTLLRALIAAMDPWESIGTIETDYELYIHDNPERHRRVLALQSRIGGGEITAAGTRAGERTPDRLIYDALRHNIERLIVGEVRGPEVLAMFQVMQAGNGSMSTVHADSARDVVERLVGLAVSDARFSETYAYRQVAQSIDLILYISTNVSSSDGRINRYISQVIEVTRGEAGNPVAITDVFAPDARGRAVPTTAPTFMDDLIKAGFDRTLFTYRAGLWDEEVP